MFGARLRFVALGIAAACLALPLTAATHNVTSTADTGPNTLRAAVLAASNGDTITFDASIAGQTIILTSGEIDISANISIGGGVKISGNSASRIFKIAALKTVSIQSLTFQDGFDKGANGAAGVFGSPGFGGAIWNQGTLHLLSCHFTNNHVQGGDGGAASGGPPGNGGSAFGGAIFNDATGSLDMTTCEFDGNGALGGKGGTGTPGGTGGLADGGAVRSTSLFLSIAGSTFESNTAHGGQGGNTVGDGGLGEGGALSTIDQQFSLSDSSFLQNTATGGAGSVDGLSAGGNGGDGKGGALFVASDTTPTVDRSTFDQNGASAGSGFDISHTGDSFGGGIALVGDLTIRDSTISNNSADLGSEGGGIFASGTIDVVNCTLTGNSVAEGSGGGFSSDQSASLTNVTISGNTSQGLAGGIHISGHGTTTIVNTIVAKNTAGSFNPDGQIDSQAVVSGGHNVIGVAFGAIAGGSFTPAAGDQIGTVISPLDPGLDPLGSNGGPTKTMALKLTSPALDHGDDTQCPPKDQTTITTRPQGAFSDVGAFELPAVTGPGGNAFTLTIDLVGIGSVTSSPS